MSQSSLSSNGSSSNLSHLSSIAGLSANGSTIDTQAPLDVEATGNNQVAKKTPEQEIEFTIVTNKLQRKWVEKHKKDLELDAQLKELKHNFRLSNLKKAKPEEIAKWKAQRKQPPLTKEQKKKIQEIEDRRIPPMIIANVTVNRIEKVDDLNDAVELDMTVKYWWKINKFTYKELKQKVKELADAEDGGNGSGAADADLEPAQTTKTLQVESPTADGASVTSAHASKKHEKKHDPDKEAWWEPGFQIKNQAELEFKIPIKKSYTMYDENYGVICYTQRYVGTVEAAMDLKLFPFDVQEFKIELESYQDETYWKCDIYMLRNLGDEQEFTYELNDMLKEWTVYRVQSNQGPGNEYELILLAGRKYQFYLYKLMSVLGMIVIMSFATFVLPAEDMTGRMSINVTLFLAAVALNFVVSGSIPKLSYMTAFDWFMVESYLLLVLVVIENMLSYMYTMNQAGEPPQNWDHWLNPVDFYSGFVFPVAMLIAFGYTIGFNYYYRVQYLKTEDPDKYLYRNIDSDLLQESLDFEKFFPAEEQTAPVTALGHLSQLAKNKYNFAMTGWYPLVRITRDVEWLQRMLLPDKVLDPPIEDNTVNIVELQYTAKQVKDMFNVRRVMMDPPIAAKEDEKPKGLSESRFMRVWTVTNDADAPIAVKEGERHKGLNESRFIRVWTVINDVESKLFYLDREYNDGEIDLNEEDSADVERSIEYIRAKLAIMQKKLWDSLATVVGTDELSPLHTITFVVPNLKRRVRRNLRRLNLKLIDFDKLWSMMPCGKRGRFEIQEEEEEEESEEPVKQEEAPKQPVSIKSGDLNA